MTELIETKLPGVGTIHTFEAESGTRVGVISHHSGRREVAIYHRDDPDCVSESANLSPEEARILADLLGGTTVSQRLDDLRQDIAGLAIDWLPIRDDSPYAGKTIGDTEMRRRTGVSIVALVRNERPIPAPEPDQGLRAGDTAVVVGTPQGINMAIELLS
ncbi:MAG: cation:proton antiporter regulatory subunit [Acidimicrobiales bacterium]|nr:cation:proton antiporter regulatory subunit [Acidimicrobiales bacterium]